MYNKCAHISAVWLVCMQTESRQNTANKSLYGQNIYNSDSRLIIKENYEDNFD